MSYLFYIRSSEIVTAIYMNSLRNLFSKDLAALLLEAHCYSSMNIESTFPRKMRINFCAYYVTTSTSSRQVGISSMEKDAPRKSIALKIIS